VTPFWLRRPFLILRDLFAQRERPDLDRLGRIDDAESFVWAILPHAARTFSACIAMLPARSALPAAVAYLYCRMLDTYEDLVPNSSARDASLRAFAARLAVGGNGSLPPAPAIEDSTDRDERDRAHLLLVRRAHLVDQVFLSFDESTRGVVRDLVHDMADGMRWSNVTFETQGGVLTGEDQLAQYCRHVLGNAVVFGVRLIRLEHGTKPDLTAAEREDAMRIGEMVQLANITRDVEKDLLRGIAYDASLREDLGEDASNGDRALAERCRVVRERLLRMALTRAPSYRRIIEALELRGWSVARASGVLMLLFTERYFRGCARRVGVAAWDGTHSMIPILTRTFLATVSRRRAFHEIARIERAFLLTAHVNRGGSFH
jgi:phytoene/squalene synthetase